MAMYVTNGEDFRKALSSLRGSKVVGLDLETTSLSPHEGKIRLIQISNESGIYIFDLFRLGDISELIRFLGSEDVVKVGHNLRFDQAWLLHKYNLELWPLLDSFRASRIIYNGIPGLNHDLWSVLKRELKVGTDWASDEQKSDWSVGELSTSQLEYAALDVKHLLPLRDAIKKKLSEKKLFKTAVTEFGAVLPEAAIELAGFYLNTEAWLKIAKENEFKKDLLTQRLIALFPNPNKQLTFDLPGIGTDFNLDSPSQVLQSLQMKGVPIEDTREETLILQSDKFPVVKQLLDYREVSKQLSSFGVEYLKYVNKITGRIHASFFPFTGAGRYACLPKTSKVATDRGILDIGSVRPGDLIQTVEGPRKVTRFVDSGVKPVRKFTTERGRSLVCTGDHIVFCNGRWVRADQVSLGDFFCISGVEGPDISTGYVELPGLPKLGGRKVVKAPSVLDERLAFFLGHFVAEGCIAMSRQRSRKRPTKWTSHLEEGEESPKSVIIAFGHEECALKDFISKEVRDLFGIEVRDCKSETSPSVAIDSKELASWLMSLCGRYSREVRVPEQVFMSPLSVRRAFLKGLFEGDGGVMSHSPTLSTESSVLAGGVGMLLSSLGILWSRRKKRRENGSEKNIVSILSGYRTEDIFWSDKKKVGVGQSTEGAGVYWPMWADKDLVYDNLKNYFGWEGPNEAQRKSWSTCFRSNKITALALDWIYDSLVGDSDTERFLKFANSGNLYGVKVVKIEYDGETEVCDIEVEGAHSFLVDGILVHNCSKPNLAQIPRDLKFRACFCAPPGRKIVVADYGAIEMRVAAEISNDVRLIEAFRQNKDIHSYTASLAMKVPEDSVTKVQRQQAKCFHPDTEVLTRTGWKRIETLSTEESIIQAIPGEEGIMFEWVKPLAIYKRKSPGELIHLKNEGVDIRVTPDHRMLVRRSTGAYSTVSPEEMGKARRWYNAGFLEGGNEVDSRLLKLAVATQADGSFGGRRVRFGFKKQRKVDRLLSLLCDGEYSTNKKEGVTTIAIQDILSRKIKSLLDEKSFPWTWLNLSSYCRAVVLEEAAFWDSCCRDDWRMFRFNSTDSQSIEVLQAIATITKRKSRKVSHLKEGRRKIYGLSVKRNDSSRGGNLLTERVSYNGDVVCLSVPSSFVLVRDRGVPIVTGQCVNFGLIFGMGAETLVRYAKTNYGVEMSLKKAEEFRREYFEAYKGIQKWHRVQIEEVRRKKVTRTIGGRLRYLDADKNFNEILNSPIQGTAADGLKNSLRFVHKRLTKNQLDAFIVHHVHDEIIIECAGDDDTVQAVTTHLHDGMVEGMAQYLKKVPIVVEPASGDSWAEAK